jgi:L-threonylcarbamoyladenylate synthase
VWSTEIGTNLEEAVQHLLQGELVSIPTETVYGLAADALNPIAVAKIFSVKNRPSFNPLIMHFASIEEIEQYTTNFHGLAYEIASQFMPGPISILLSRDVEKVPDIVCAGLPQVAVRIPQKKLTLSLIEMLGRPLCAPSANKSGYVSPTSAKHVYVEMQGLLPYILDGGPAQVGLESTIIEVIEDKVYCHRQGGLALEEIEAFTGEKVHYAIPHHAKPSASGQLKSHYATNTPLYHGEPSRLIAQNHGRRIAVISFQKKYSQDVDTFILSEKGNLEEAAHQLFKVLRDLDTMNYDMIVAEIFPQSGLGLAINDRLHRAQEVMKEN